MAQVWLVTGSSRGLGRAIVEAGLAAGNKVLATARGIESLADLSGRYGDQVKLFALDVTDEAAAANAVMSAIDLFGSRRTDGSHHAARAWLCRLHRLVERDKKASDFNRCRVGLSS